MRNSGKFGERFEEFWPTVYARVLKVKGGKGRGGVSPRVFTLCSAANLSTSWTFECLSAENSGKFC